VNTAKLDAMSRDDGKSLAVNVVRRLDLASVIPALLPR
jgi:hypothetical protein